MKTLKSKWFWILLPFLVGLVYFYDVFAFAPGGEIIASGNIFMMFVGGFEYLIFYPFAVLYIVWNIWSALFLALYAAFIAWILPKIHSTVILWILLAATVVAMFLMIDFVYNSSPVLLLP